MPETIFWWVFSLACVFAFFFGYGMVEDLFRQWLANRGAEKKRLTTEMLQESPDPRGNGHSDSLLH